MAWSAASLLALLLVAQGCAGTTPHWVRPGATAAQVAADRDECLARSQEYLATGENRADHAALERCMAQKGYAASRPPR